MENKKVTQECWLCQRADLPTKENPFQSGTKVCIGCYQALDEAFDFDHQYRGEIFSALMDKTRASESALERDWLRHLCSQHQEDSMSSDPEFRESFLKQARERIRVLEAL